MNIANCDGLYVGLLTPEELAEFNLWVAAGKAWRSYQGPGGELGLAKVRIGHSIEPLAKDAEHA